MWDNDKIEKLLREHEDEAYREFHGGLTKTSYSRIGVRVPVLRKIAKEIVKSDEWEEFLSVRPIVFYEHAMLAGIISATVKEPYEEKIKRLKAFSEDIDDWAVCDITCSSLKCKDGRLLADMCGFAVSEDIWLARMGIVVLLGNFAYGEYLDVLRETVNGVVAKDYYIDMALGWLICTLESHSKGAGIELMKTAKISQTVKKMATSKMRDSYRVSVDIKKQAAELAKV